MRLIEIFEAIPTLFLLIIFIAFFARNIYLMMAIIGLTGWTGDARFIRAEFLSLRNSDFVQAAIAAGLPLWLDPFRHMLPNGIAPVLVTRASASRRDPARSDAELPGPRLVDEPSWGQLLNQARAGGAGFVWWIAMFPGLAIFLTVFAYNLIGECHARCAGPEAAEARLNSMGQHKPLLEIQDLNVAFDTNRGDFGPCAMSRSSIYPGQTVALVGEAGAENRSRRCRSCG